MTPTPDDWQTFAALLGILGLLGGAVVALQRLGFLGRANAPPRAGAVPPEVSQRLDRHAERQAQFEGALKGLASSKDIHELQIAMERQAADIRELRTAMERDAKAVGTLSAQITRIEDHLMQEARK